MALFAVLVSATAFRLGILDDDRTWFDEDYVVAGSLGLSTTDPFPRSFVHTDIYAPSFRRTLSYLKQHDAYPPAQYLAVFAAKDTTHPIFAVRFAFLVVSLAAPLVVFSTVRTVASPGPALLAAALVAFSPAQALVSQQIKWYAIAPTFACLSSALLFLAQRRGGGALWCGYSVANASLLLTHYFGVWVFPSHLLWMVIVNRPKLRAFALAWLGTAALCAPWYAYGLPSQLQYVKAYFSGLETAADHNWARPVTPTNLAIWLGYNGLVGVGAQPSVIRARYLSWLLPLTLWLLWRACRSHDSGRRQLALLGTAGFALALAAQTLYAVRLGHTTPLTWGYLVQWMPWLCGALALGLATLSRLIRWLLGVGMASLAVFNLFHHHFPEQIVTSGSLSNYLEVVAVVRDRRDAGLAYLNARDAKKVNVFYRGSAPQFVGWPQASEMPAAMDCLLWITPTGASIPASDGSAWLAPAAVAVAGSTSISVSCLAQREPPTTSPTSTSEGVQTH